MNHTQETAETIGLQCLAWLAGNEELLPVFLGATGASEEDIRTRAQDPEFLGFVMDFMMMDDNWVMDFCATQGLPNESLMFARAALPGGQQVNWT